MNKPQHLDFKQLQGSVHLHIASPIWTVDEKLFQLRHMAKYIESFDYDAQVESDLRDIFMSDAPDATESEFQAVYQDAIQNREFYQGIRATIESHVELLGKLIKRAINLLTQSPKLNDDPEKFYRHICYNLEVSLVNIIESQQDVEKRLNDLNYLRDGIQTLQDGDGVEYEFLGENTPQEQQAFMQRSQRMIDKLSTEPNMDGNSLYAYVFAD